MPKEVKMYTSKKTGETKSLNDWSKSTGISISTLFCRVKRGMNIDEAIEESFKESMYDAITDPITGETHSLIEWSNITGVPVNTLRNRIKKYKWPIDKALHAKRYESVKRKPRPKSSYKHIDLTGRRFGHLVVLRRADTDYVCMCNGKEKSEWKWLCRCDCDNTVEVIQHNLLNGHTTSCGCFNINNLTNMTGKKCGHLTVLNRAPDKIVNGERTACWNCKCDCGNPEIVVVSGHDLRNGHTTSCGCMVGGKTHGKKHTRIYGIYSNMMDRCYNQNNANYYRYGGRGIYICDEWYGYGEGFVNFYNWAIKNGYSDDLTIDRINNDGPYSPDNCRWATHKEQANNRSNNVRFTCDGKTMTSSEWADELGVNNATLLARHDKGWSDEDVIRTPIDYSIKIVTSSSGESHTLKEWSEISGINSKTLYDRIFRLNWDVDRALVTGATNPDVYNHINYTAYVAQQNPGYYYYPNAQGIYHPAIVYTDDTGKVYTQEEVDDDQ